MPALIALLFALVIAAFFVSRRVGLIMLSGVSVAVALMFAWTWHTRDVIQARVDVIPIEQVEIADTRMRGNTRDHLLRNHSEEWTLKGLRTEKIARLEDGTVLDRREFNHPVDIPPGQARWVTLRFFGLQIGVEYELRIIGTEGMRDPDSR